MDSTPDLSPNDQLAIVLRYCFRGKVKIRQTDGPIDRLGVPINQWTDRSHLPQCTASLSARTIRRHLQQSGLSARRPLFGLLLTQNPRRLRRQWGDERRMWVTEWNEVDFTDESRICLPPRWSDSSLETPWREDAEHLRYAPPHWSCTGYYGMERYWIHPRTPLVRIAGTLNSQPYISEVMELVVLPYFQGLATAIFQQDNAQPQVTRIVQRFFVNHQIELLPWPAHSLDLSPIENMWSMAAQRLTQITPLAATPDQLWKRVEAAWFSVPQEPIQ
ncbi:transposable element Tcb1 transposase [Trichonephila clavipes]|uniref:Transposable element Tcb1 transposase n=1 Tax=Trichonephila clavipes TaxID=2585209 RepID=A0A8X6VRS1_TRICX|nr:transposable element Tcb1 transposase [Trichonephila clavipes]